MGLDDGMFIVHVNDKSGHPVTLAMYKPVSVGGCMGRKQLFTVIVSSFDLPEPEIIINCLFCKSEDADHDCAMMKMPCGQVLVICIIHFHHGSFFKILYLAS